MVRWNAQVEVVAFAIRRVTCDSEYIWWEGNASYVLHTVIQYISFYQSRTT